MIYIEKDSTNNFVLTLTESSRVSNPYYIFSFQNEYQMDSKPILFYTPDISNYTCRYNQFKLIESATGSTTGGIDIPLKLVPGQYTYTVYEQDFIPVNLQIKSTTGRIVEEGRMFVSIDETYVNEVNNSVIGLTSSVYI